MKLTPAQENIIVNCVDAQGLKMPSLRDDVIDHLCCVLETQLNKGKPFEELLDEAIKDLAPKGLAAIQHETLFYSILNAY